MQALSLRKPMTPWCLVGDGGIDPCISPYVIPNNRPHKPVPQSLLRTRQPTIRTLNPYGITLIVTLKATLLPTKNQTVLVQACGSASCPCWKLRWHSGHQHWRAPAEQLLVLLLLYYYYHYYYHYHYYYYIISIFLLNYRCVVTMLLLFLPLLL